jgi:predicted transcriptional regulator of viral defense system
MKELILEQFEGRYCTIDEIADFVTNTEPGASRNTVVWNVNDLVKKGSASRVGRGVYSFNPKPQFEPKLGGTATIACELVSEKFKYLDVTVTDAGVLNEFMNLLPFASIVSLETKKSATGAVLSALRKDGVDAYAKSDYPRLEKYISTSNPVIVRPELAANPTLKARGKVHYANLEKTLVDLVCDDAIYGQYQGEELENIYRDATERYAVNYSQMLKYANARKKKLEVLSLLVSTPEFKKVRELL